MGKKSKLYKSGLPRNQIKKPFDSKLKKLIANPPKTSNISQNAPEKIEKKNFPKINYNLDNLQKVNETFGLTNEQIKELFTRPMRNRRFVNNLTLSRREKKKAQRKMKKELKQEMEEKTKLDITLNPNLHQKNNLLGNNSLCNFDKKNKNKNQTTIGFNFDDMNNIMNDMVEDEEKKEINRVKNNNSSARIHKQRNNIIYNEANKIENVLNNKEFDNNPNLMMKMQIQENQKINERNKQIRDEFNQKYNLLNLK